MKKCKCLFCKTYKRYKWAVIKECKCTCHTSDGMTGHDSLCCEFPNGLVTDIPYKRLRPLKYYKDIIDKWEQSCL